MVYYYYCFFIYNHQHRHHIMKLSIELGPDLDPTQSIRATELTRSTTSLPCNKITAAELGGNRNGASLVSEQHSYHSAMGRVIV